MISSQQILSHKQYSHAQIEHFVCVDSFVFLNKNDLTYLLIQFSNHADFTVHDMDFSVTQLDSTGAAIQSGFYSINNLQLEPEQIAYSRDGILVDDACTDIILSFHDVRSGDYRYHINGNAITVSYAPAEETTEQPKKKKKHRFWRKPTIAPNAKMLSQLCALVLLILFVLSICYVIDFYVRTAPWIQSLSGFAANPAAALSPHLCSFRFFTTIGDRLC